MLLILKPVSLDLPLLPPWGGIRCSIFGVGECFPITIIQMSAFPHPCVLGVVWNSGSSQILALTHKSKSLHKTVSEWTNEETDCLGSEEGLWFFFFFKLWDLFIYGYVGSSFLCEGFLQLRRAGATLHRGARASHYRGLSRCGAQAPDAQAQ